MLEINNIYKTFNPGTVNEKVALNGVSLKLNDGDFVTVIGGNGAGKSTLLNAVAGTWKVDEGSILIDGIDVTKMQDYKRAKFLGRVFQDPMMGTVPTMGIDENLALAARRGKFRGLAREITAKERAGFKEIVKILDLGLEDRLTSKVGLLSGGQRQTLALLMATMNPIEFLILDEHTAALDPKTAEIVMQLTGKIVAEKKVTTIMVTHNLRYAVEYGNRILMMHQGHAVLDKAGEEKAKIVVDDLLDLLIDLLRRIRFIRLRRCRVQDHLLLRLIAHFLT